MSRLPALLLLAGSLATVNLTAQAGTESVQIRADRAARSAAELRAFSGVYVLADGRQLEVSQRGRRLFATLDSGETSELVPVGASRFASRDGRLSLDFVEHDNGVVSAVKLTTGGAAMARR